MIGVVCPGKEQIGPVWRRKPYRRGGLGEREKSPGVRLRCQKQTSNAMTRKTGGTPLQHDRRRLIDASSSSSDSERFRNLECKVMPEHQKSWPARSYHSSTRFLPSLKLESSDRWGTKRLPVKKDCQLSMSVVGADFERAYAFATEAGISPLSFTGSFALTYFPTCLSHRQR